VRKNTPRSKIPFSKISLGISTTNSIFGFLSPLRKILGRYAPQKLPIRSATDDFPRIFKTPGGINRGKRDVKSTFPYSSARSLSRAASRFLSHSSRKSRVHSANLCLEILSTNAKTDAGISGYRIYIRRARAHVSPCARVLRFRGSIESSVICYAPVPCRVPRVPEDTGTRTRDTPSRRAMSTQARSEGTTPVPHAMSARGIACPPCYAVRPA
jgi:hypothetical protein